MQEKQTSHGSHAESASPPAPPSTPEPRQIGTSAPGFEESVIAAHSNPMLEPLMAAISTQRPGEDPELVYRAFVVAEKAHRGQMRKSGEPYITHPVAVTTILAELGTPIEVLAAALLHDTVEDTEYSLEECRADFGETIAVLVDGVTKLDKVQYGAAAQAETVRKMIVAMSRDVRVLLIKLADRLHNARTWKYVSGSSAERKAKETLEIYAPLAHRLGLNTIKWELEDLSFQVLYPKVYDEIVALVARHAPARERFMGEVTDLIEQDLSAQNITATVTGRPKHYYSIYQKMIVRGRDFADIYDLVGIRVLVDTIRDCYAVLGALHARWNPIPGRFKDYIALPKFNLYQSLHTTVIGPAGKPVEIQIRTWEMHRRAEYGVAAHWKYKAQMRGDQAAAGSGGETVNGEEMSWLRQLMDWQKETSDADEFLDSLRFEMNTREVYVFTPRGDVIALPQGSTPVDFAYSVHTEVGHRTMSARVNGKIVSLKAELNTGDVVEVFTSKAEGAGPSRDWLNFVKSPRARARIRQWFSKERREESLENGRDELAKELRKQNLPLRRMLTHELLSQVALQLDYDTVDSLYTAIGEHTISAHSVVQRLIDSLGGTEGTNEDQAEAVLPSKVTSGRQSTQADQGVVVDGESDLWVKLAKCCAPVPGDPIVGFVTRGAGVSVHHRQCSNAIDMQKHQPDRFVDVHWSDHTHTSYLVHIKVEALDRSRLLTDLANAVSDQHVNMLSASCTADRDRLATAYFSFELADPGHLGLVLNQIRRVDGVFDAFRVSSDGRPMGHASAG